MASTSCQSTPRYTFAFGHEGSMQMVHRVFELLRLVAAERGGGLRLTDIAERSQLPLPTAHRLLRSLEAERAVIYDPFMRVYYVGYDFLQQPRDTLDGRLRQHFHSLLQQVAEHTDGTALLATMQEYDVLYIDLVAAMFPPGNPMVVGGRRPLGAGPAGVVLLASLPPRKQHEVIMANAQRYLRFNGIDSRRVHAMVQEFRREGYSFGTTIVPGVGAVAIPVHDALGKTVASLSISSTSERLEPRCRQVADWLLDRVAGWEPFHVAPRDER